MRIYAEYIRIRDRFLNAYMHILLVFPLGRQLAILGGQHRFSRINLSAQNQNIKNPLKDKAFC